MLLSWPPVFLICVIAAAADRPAAAQQRPHDAPASLGPSRDLYFIELVPAPGIGGVSGSVELGHVPGPFTVAVTPGGLPRHRLVLSVSGLPPASTLGPYRTYVAWAATPAMHPIVRLGEVANGRTVLGEVNLEKFVFLVSAEAGARSKEPAGRVVIRGQSPSTPALSTGSIGVFHRPYGSDGQRGA